MDQDSHHLHLRGHPAQSGLYYLVKDKGSSKRTVKALSFRIGLSLGLFLFLMALIGLGVIKPHGLYPQGHPATQPNSAR